LNILNKKGFNFIEVIISLVIIGLIVSSFSYLFSLSIDLPILSDKSKALYYAESEIEKLNNTNYDSIVSISKTQYPDDTNYDYEIIVQENSQKNNKDVWVNFYLSGKNSKLVELYSKFIKLERIKICEDFQDGSWNAPTWNWNLNPPGQWSLVIFPTGSENYRARYGRRQLGYIYPDWSGSSNYSVSLDFYIQSGSLINTSTIRLYGRYNNSTNNGYCLEVSCRDLTSNITIYKVTNGSLINLRSVPVYDSLFDSWHSIKLEMNGNNLRGYLDDFNNPIVTATDNNNPYLSGGIRVGASSTGNFYYVYIDNVCVEEVVNPWGEVFL